MNSLRRIIQARRDKRTQKRWQRHVEAVNEYSMRDLRSQIIKASAIDHQLKDFLRKAEDRVTIPKIGSDAFRDGRGTDWTWRGDAWRWRAAQVGHAAVENGKEIAPSLRLFHDCALHEITTRQIRNQKEEDVAPFGIQLDVLGFQGSFLSIVLNLPSDATAGLRKNHLVRLNTIIEVEKPIEIYARLNIQHGPNSENLVRGLSSAQKEGFVEFEMDMVKLNEKRIEHMWLDIIFDNPAMNKITLRELSMSRKPKSDF